MNDIPDAPPCINRSGAIHCDCVGTECIARRMLWLHARAVVDASNTGARTRILDAFRPDVREAVRRIAVHIINHGAHGNA